MRVKAADDVPVLETFKSGPSFPLFSFTWSFQNASRADSHRIVDMTGNLSQIRAGSA